MEMIVRLVIKPERKDVVLDRLDAVVRQTRDEEGCVEFVVYTAESPDEIWIKETYVTQAYHDDVHESAQVVKDLLAWLPGETTEPWIVSTVRRVLER